jgi:hypothetical protein
MPPVAAPVEPAPFTEESLRERAPFGMAMFDVVAAGGLSFTHDIPAEPPCEPLDAFEVNADTVADLAGEAPPEPPPLALRMPIRVRIGGPDDAPEWRRAEVAKLGGYGISALVHLDGQHDPHLSPALKQHGTPAHSGACLVLPNVTEGSDVGQWSRVP